MKNNYTDVILSCILGSALGEVFLLPGVLLFLVVFSPFATSRTTGGVVVPHAGVKDGTNSQKAAQCAVTRTARVRRQQDSNLQQGSSVVPNDGRWHGSDTTYVVRALIFHPRDIYSGMSRDATDTHTSLRSSEEERPPVEREARVSQSLGGAMRGLVGAAGNDAETVNDPGSCNPRRRPRSRPPTIPRGLGKSTDA